MGTTSHREVERKYELAPDGELPTTAELAGVEGVGAVDGPEVAELEATYHDTVDLRLLRAGITLRRRTGGGDAGWHLKLPEALDTRLELRRPLGRSARLPRPVRDLVLATTRGERLAPVAVIRTRRSTFRLLDAAGEPFVELADDQVEAEAVGADEAPVAWRELELEVDVVASSNGEEPLDVLDRIGEVLVRSGAAPSTAPSKIANVLGDRLAAAERSAAHGGAEDGTAGQLVLAHLGDQREQLVALDPLVRQDVPDSVHKMRVAVRRLRSALRTYRRLLDRSVTDPLRDELKWLGGVLGPVRDAEVITARIEELLDDEPRSLIAGSVRRRLRRTLGAEQRQARAELLVRLRGERYLHVLEVLDDIVAGGALRAKRAAKPARKQVRKALRRQHERWHARVDAATALDAAGDEDRLDEALHEVRKASKRVRYGAESAQPAFGSEAEVLAGAMEDLQDLLGEHQDTVVTRGVLRRLAQSAHADGDDTFTWGRLHAREQATAEQLTLRFLDEIEGTATRPSWLD